MAGLDSLLSLAGGGGSSTSGGKYIAPQVPINVQPVGLNLGQLFQPSNLGTTGTIPLLAGGPTQAAIAQSSLLSSGNMPLLLIAVAAGFLLLKGR